MKATPQLVVEPEVYRFSSHEGPGLDELMEVLQSQRDTRPVTIEHPQDVLLNHEGRIQQQFRLTTTALQQLCSVIAPGLLDVVRSISGMRARKQQYAHEGYSMPKAVELLNSLIKFRFDVLSGHALIVDRRQRQIEGVVGQRYRFLSNLEMFERVSEFLSSQGQPLVFCEAALAGRRLLLRYRSPERAFALQTPHQQKEPFYAGVHFSNSELGDCCVKGSFILYRQWSKTSSVAPFTDQTKLAHFQGEKFNGRFFKVLEAVRASMSDALSLEESVRAVAAEKLGFGGTPEEYKTRLAQVVTSLSRGGVGRKIGSAAVHRALVHGSYKTEMVRMGQGKTAVEVLSPAILKAFSRRTVYDLYTGLCHIARRGLPADQELLEQRAHDVLTGNITIS